MASRKYTTRKNNGEKKELNGVIGLILVILSVFCLICLVIAPLLSSIGYAIRGTLLGIFGYFSYPFFVSLLITGISMLRSMKLRFSGKNIALLCAIGVALVFLLQTVTSGGITGTIDEYIAYVWDTKNTVGGLLFGVLAFAIQSVITKVGAIIFYVALMLIFGALLVYSALSAYGIIKSKKKEPEAPKQFVHGAAPPTPVRTVRNSGLYVDTIIPKQSIYSSPEPEETNQTVSEEGIAGRIRPDERVAVDKYSDKKIEFERTDLTPEKQKAHQILFGDKSLRSVENSSPFTSYSGVNPHASSSASSSSSSFIPYHASSSGSSYGRFRGGSNAGYEEQLRTFRKLSENTIPDADSKPFVEEPKPEKKSSDSLIPEKDISADYVGGYIINGDEVSARYQKHEDPKDIADASEKKDNFVTSYVKTQSDDGRPPIINGDYISERQQEKNLRTSYETERFPEKRDTRDDDKDEDKHFINGDFFSVPEKSDSVKDEPKDEIADFGRATGMKNNTADNNDAQTQVVSDDSEDRQKKVEESIDRLIRADRTIRDYLQNRGDGSEDKDSGSSFISFDSKDNDFDAFDKFDSFEDVKPVKPINPVITEFPDNTLTTDNKNSTGDVDLSSGVETNEQKGVDMTNDSESDATKGFNFISEAEDLSENDVPEDTNSGYYEKANTEQKTTIKDDTDFENIDVEESEIEDDIEETKEEKIADTTQNHEEDPKEDLTEKHNSAEDDFRFSQMQSYVSSVKSKKDKVSENQIGIDEYMANNSTEVDAIYSIKCRYSAPPLALLRQESTDYMKLSGDTEKNSALLEEVLDSFKFPAKVITVVPGPAVTRYELEIPRGVPIKKIEERAPDIAYELASNGKIRIETPIPGKKAVGVEVPNKEIGIVGLKDIIGSKEFKTAASPLTLALGKDIAGEVILCNLEKMPHLLIAGSTNSGKSSCLNSIITSIIYKASPEDVRLILIDPKQVEFSMYMGIPHLLINEIIKDSEQAINALKWSIDEMENRYKLFSAHSCRNIKEYNSMDAVKDGTMKKLPFIVIVVDEFSALMGGKNKDIEDKIIKIAQKSRAAGIHLILATQRPSVDVITGTIKANLPSRIAFAVTSYNDSRTILDKGGAETLLGRGDMLYSPIDYNEPKRVQGAYIDAPETDDIVKYAKTHNKCVYYEEAQQVIMAKPEEKAVDTKEEEGGETMDSLMPDVLQYIINAQQVSATLIQRKFSVGYARAARILDQMETHKFVGVSDNKKSREIYITKEMYEKLFGKKI